jgi:hypothetical protein
MEQPPSAADRPVLIVPCARPLALTSRPHGFPQSATAVVEMVGIQPVTVRAHCVRSPVAFILMTIGAVALQFDDRRIVERAQAAFARHDLAALPRHISPHRFVRRMDDTSPLGMALRLRDGAPLGSRLEPSKPGDSAWLRAVFGRIELRARDYDAAMSLRHGIERADELAAETFIEP